MITQTLDFNPHLVWAMEDGFHLWGYKGSAFLTPNHRRIYCYLKPNSFISLKDEVCDNVRHFNHVIPHKDHLILLHHRYYLSQPYKNGELEVTEEMHNVIKDTFQNIHSKWGKANQVQITSMVEHKEGRYRSWTHYLRPPRCANFDINATHTVLAWGRSLMINNHYFMMDKSCTDAKISPDGGTVAVSTGTTVMFMDINTKMIKHTMELNRKIDHLAYSLDGLTIAAITNRQLIIWDVE
jgi:hypothetical protein